VQPDSQKSTSQKASDSVSGGSNDAQKQGEGVLKNAQDSLSNAANSVSESLGGGNSK